MTTVFLWLMVSVALIGQAYGIELNLPKILYATEGQPMRFYFSHMLHAQAGDGVQVEVQSPLGEVKDTHLWLLPLHCQVGEHELNFFLRDANGIALGQKKVTLKVAPQNAAEDHPLKWLIVGDSLTAATHYPNELARLLSQPGGPTWGMLGTHLPSHAKEGVKHEGYGGWTWRAFLERWNPVKEGEAAGPIAKRSTSPFLYSSATGSGEMDLSRYFRENGGVPNVVSFLLGINDCFSAPYQDEKKLDAHIEGVLEHAEKLIKAFHAAAPHAILAVGLPTPGNARAEAFDANYHGKYSRDGWNKIQRRLVQKMIERWDGEALPNVVLVPTHLNLDIQDGYPPDNAVHPNPAGYAQIAQSFHASVMNQCYEQRIKPLDLP